MLLDAVVLSAFTVAGCWIIYNKLPRKVRRFMAKHSLLTDVLAMLATYSFLGGTLTALTAAALAGIIVSSLLYIATHPNDFLYLWDLRDYMKKKSAELKNILSEYGAQYREQQDKQTRLDHGVYQ